MREQYQTSLFFYFIIFAPVVVTSFYLPGAIPNAFREGEPVKLKIGPLTSPQHSYSVDHYHLPFCEPHEGVKVDNENLGEVVQGQVLYNSPYKIHMKEDVYCAQICIANLGRKESRNVSPNKTIRAIRKRFQNNWVIDNLPALSSLFASGSEQSENSLGFPLGFVYEKKSYIYNHVNIYLDYVKVDDSDLDTTEEEGQELYRIVKFSIEPLSIAHKFKRTKNPDDDLILKKHHGSHKYIADMVDPVPSCDYRISEALRKHTTSTGSDTKQNDEKKIGPQKASRHVLFTYDVIWKENKEISWSSRWDLYLQLQDAGSPGEKAHWLSISNCIVSVVFLILSIFWILMNRVQKDAYLYSITTTGTDEEMLNENEKTYCDRGWHNVSNDVFRAPSQPLVLSVTCGTGIQLMCMTLCTIILGTIGSFSPDDRDAIFAVLMASYVLSGYVAGSSCGVMYKNFGGRDTRSAVLWLSIAFPLLVFGVIVILNCVAANQEKHEHFPVSALLRYLLMWLGISSPLVYMGFQRGFNLMKVEYPSATNFTPRTIPRQPLYLRSIFTMSAGSATAFSFCFYEVSNVMQSVWIDEYYYIFGLLAICTVSLFLTSATMSVFMNYFHLSYEDYRWWWRSWFTGAFTAFEVFLYSIYYATKFETKEPIVYIYYFGYMSLLCFALSIMLGTFSFIVTFLFNKSLYKGFVSRCLKLS